MSIQDLGSLGELVAAIATVVTLLYLATQIKNSTNQFRAQIEDEIQQSGFDAYSPVYEGNNAEALWVGMNEPQNLSHTQKLVFELLLHRHMGVLYSMARKARKGHVDNDVLDGYIRHYRYTIFGSEGGKKWLQENREYLTADPDQNLVFQLLTTEA
jgi:hypothetical protein